ncbi:hypothetical protein FRC04_007650 [Tulasnella sp. 424]|nr:hypothetical protein FRC04_007650 [Tulasnella sp. 424]KAG8979082.1 hypothetical protein FRC05_009292 [Tulasnella sp. 425]
MAYYAASSPPPPKAPSLAPTTNSELTSAPLPPPPVEEKKKKSFAKKILKELAGGGGNNVKIKGAPVVRPYGRGGVGVKPAGAKSQASLSTTSSKSPPSSVHQSQPSAQVSSPSPPAPRLPHQQRSPVEEDPRYLTNDYYAPGPGGDYDDNQSTLSSIPAPRRTQQWIQQHAHHAQSQLPSPPNSSTGAPSPYGNGGRDPYPMSPAPSQYMGSQYSRGSDGDPYYQQSQYPGGYVPSSQARRGTGRLPDVDEDGDFDQQFGRLNIGSPPNRTQYTSSPATSISTRRTPTVFSSNTGHSTARTPASQYAARYMANGAVVDEYRDDVATGRYDRSQYTTSPQQQHPQQGGATPPLDSATALVVEQYLARQGIAVPPGLLDQYRTTGPPATGANPASATPAPSAQTRELQSQIDALREAERKARERLEALRKDDGLRSGSAAPSAARKDSDLTARLDVMGHSSPVDAASSSRPGRRPGTGDSGQSEAPSRPLTTQERALIEKEKLRQRDMERERELREREALLAAQASASNPLYGQQPALDPLTALLQAAQQQQNPMYQQQNLMMQALAAQQYQQAAAAGGSVPSPTLGYGDLGQQNLIMQLGALLLQQQQQLQMLAAGRAAAASPVPPDPTMSPPAAPSLDLNTLLALGAGLPNPQAGLAALLQQQQQGQQSPPASYPLPLLTTTAPSASGHGNTTGSQSSISLDPPSPTTASTNNSILNATQSNGTNNSSTTTTSSRFSPNPTPSPKPSSKLERELDLGQNSPLIPPATAPLRLPEGLSRGGVGSFMREFNRELGLSPTTPTGANEDVVHGGSRMIPPRAEPPRVPLPDAPAGRIRRDESPASAGTGPGTPPPAYMSAR